MAGGDIVETLILLVWACLVAPVHKHALFGQIFPSQEVLSEAVQAAPLFFCEGLLQAMQASTPPSLDFFAGLPTDCSKRWGIYLLVLQKPDADPCVYIGSATSAKAGVRGRWYDYDRKRNLPYYIQRALDNGYDITQKGLLMWCPLPSAAKLPTLRLLFLAMEAMFALYFWAMQSPTKDYGMSGFCPWPKGAFAYQGLCSHSAMREGVEADFDLTQEQLEEMAAVVKEKNRQYMAEYHLRARLEDPVKDRERHRINAERFRKNSYEKYLAKFARYAEKQKEQKAFYCELCDHASTKPYEHNRHLQSKRHLKKVARGPLKAPVKKEKKRETADNTKASKKYFCALCNVACTRQAELDRHNGSKRHLAKSAKAESSSSSA